MNNSNFDNRNLQIPTEIYPIPSLPDRIKKAASDGKLIIFYGAGVSRIIGCDGWKQLSDRIVETAFEGGLITYWEKEKVKNEYDPKKAISIFKKIFQSNEYKNILKDSLKSEDEKSKKYPIYERLIKLRGIYVTTNIDDCFDSFFETKKIFVSPQDFNVQNVKNNSLFHLHGSIKNNKSIVLTTADYIIHYNKEEIKKFLKIIFNNDYIVLFIGYSLSELEILDYVLLKGNNKIEIGSNNPKELKHIILLPFHRAEKEMFKYEWRYFADLNVEAIPYAVDDIGYEQLFHVIESWEKEINISSPYLYNSYQFIEENIKDYKNENAIEILQLIKNDIPFNNHFFKYLSTPKWFFPLNEKGYFAPDKAPGPEHSNQEGYFIIPQWNVLPYLERVSQQVNIQGNERYINELLTIIKGVSNYRDANGQHIDNYRTWWSFVKILLDIPNDKISIEIIELIPIWLDSRFDITLPGSDIANKLLPKFLIDVPTAEDIKKAERITDHITKIKWVKLPERSKDILGKEKEPKTIIDTHWLLESFVKEGNAVKIGERCSEKPIYMLAEKLKEIFRHQYTSWDDVEVKDETYRITVCHTKDYEFKCAIGIIKKEESETDKPEEKFVKSLSAKTEDLIKFNIRECKNRNSFIEKLKGKISKISRSGITKEIKETLNEKAGDLYADMFKDNSYIWFGAISSFHEFNVDRTDKTLALILRDIFLAKAKMDKSTAQNIFKDFLSERYQYPLFKRLVLFVIGECWGDFKEEFWKIINAPNGEQLFDDPNYESEIYELLEKNITRFTQRKKEKLKEIIEREPQRDLSEDNQERYITYWKQKWYSAVKSDPYFSDDYKKCKKATNMKEEIGFKVSDVRVGSGSSPLSKEEILQMSNRDLAEYLSLFKTKDLWRGPTVGGLADILRVTVQEQPEKFINELSPFLNTGYLYIYHILWGIKDAWSNKKTIEWGRLFDFIEQYINRDEFWEDRFTIADDEWNANYKWVVGIVGELIQEGTKEDNWAFAENHLREAQEIIFIIIDKLKIEEEKDVRDPVNHALNSTFGKTIIALIYLALRIARLKDKKGKKKKVKWSNHMKDRYNRLLSNGVIEAYTLLGEYISQLYYLDKSWVKQKIRELKDIEDEQFWSAFMNGYLFSGRVYNELYELMKNQNHYRKAISHSFKERDAEERLVQHIAIGYLRGREDLSDDSLLGMMLFKKCDYSYIEELIQFFWMQRNDLVPESEENVKFKKKIIDFWKWLYNRYKDKESLTEDDKKILSTAAKLTVFLPEINSENFEWLMLSAPYVELDFNSPFFIEYLDELKDKGNKIGSGKYVGKIFLKILDEFTPDFDLKHIRLIVKYLYGLKKRETKRMAEKICNIYGSRGLEFLRDIYEEYKES